MSEATKKDSPWGGVDLPPIEEFSGRGFDIQADVQGKIMNDMAATLVQFAPELRKAKVPLAEFVTSTLSAIIANNIQTVSIDGEHSDEVCATLLAMISVAAGRGLEELLSRQGRQTPELSKFCDTINNSMGAMAENSGFRMEFVKPG